ncbi:MAG: hypothetical protein AVDCRST_MAG64-3406 [uncultured Phycisphaerae bacterium]|uniref:Uncharacterized protein n=1 Tax=uncultured Phycisphaerae bacterium TaxID=904963 RepID=A0A6J4PZF3_9BACT|nr:MAG: hypothetical protein AVDCRST_MAG64-3406 [uncultured Phycisphaerae bacterium]
MVEFNYTLREHGWATIDADFGDTRIRFEVSYMSHALEDFVSSVIALLTGEVVSRFALIDEQPGEHCWVINRDDDTLRIRIVRLDTFWRTECYNLRKRPGQPPPEEDGEVILSWECPMPDFVRAVGRMLRDIESRYTPTEFARTRNHGVPPDLVTRLWELSGE